MRKNIPGCTFLAFETVKDKLFFKAFIKNGKNKDRVRVQINCKLSDVGQDEYNELFDILIQKKYEN